MIGATCYSRNYDCPRFREVYRNLWNNLLYLVQEW